MVKMMCPICKTLHTVFYRCSRCGRLLCPNCVADFDIGYICADCLDYCGGVTIIEQRNQVKGKSQMSNATVLMAKIVANEVEEMDCDGMLDSDPARETDLRAKLLATHQAIGEWIRTYVRENGTGAASPYRG